MRRLAGVMVSWILLLALSANAEAQWRWLVVTSEISPPTTGDAREIAERVLTEEGETLVDTFAPTHVMVDGTSRRHALQMSQRAMVHVAVGATREAETLADQVEALAQPSLSEWNQDDTSARALFDVCLFAVRAALSDGRIEAARERLLRCRRLVPDLLPDPEFHPPNLLEFFEEEGRTQLAASFSVSGIESPCVLRLQGRPVSSTQAAFVPGTYEVEVRCSGRSGHSQVVQLAAGSPVSLAFDGTFERARSGSSLVYQDSFERTSFSLSHARQLALQSGAQRALLIAPEPDSKVVLSIIDVESGDVLSHVSAALSNLESATRELVKPRPRAVVVAPPQSRVGPWMLGVGAGSVGLLAAAAGTYALTHARARQLSQSSNYPFALQDRYARARAWTFALSASAGMLGSSAAALGFVHAKLSERAHRLLFIGSLAAGVLLAGAGTVELLRDQREPAPDVARSSEAALSSLLFAVAAPCLTWSAMEVTR